MSQPTTPRVRPVILAGGSGTRLWPVSRARHPKQFQPLAGADGLFAQTLARARALGGADPIVVCNEEHRFLAAEALRDAGMDGARILLEPAGRDTAPAIALAACEARALDGDPVLAVLPADHAITDHGAFARAVARAVPHADAGWLVTFGVTPTGPETGYGYIRVAPGEGPRRVEAFTEKPDRATAERYLADGGHYWNSGMFVFRASAGLDALGAHAPAVLSAVEAAHAERAPDRDFVRVGEAAFGEAPAVSFDRAVMERTDTAVMVPFDAGWRDVGSWRAVWEHARETGAADADGNVVSGEVAAHDVHNSLIHAESRVVGAVGLDGHLIAETPDAVLVAPLDRAQDVRPVVDALRRAGRPEAEVHRRVSRPWGAYEEVDAGEHFRVKRLVVRPGEGLSRQLHRHRAEHWVVVRGTATVELDGERFELGENQSTYIPIGATHRLENAGPAELEIVEVQTGAYLGEDDIVRFDDRYGR
ncbi:mannose-1-phosphate guanylyltransferase / mannose-6-phosphate isomerase [Limimonas halophila]|uniref:mannose-1-phosphate guanylyltransferase n=1 Tax=Limimonas halophila TaxID=1082479 RepID=A0A1G7S386_9PROT|nr:mannose-1-phosphate guanylyltransferase/mannose-6-phosphate isomerase [Limimonas halophila]SDG17456.1 mannose-1-phosphate guanylyltransferase / mannose-6-phosphate isomerase [Limimonas halophila]